MRRGVCKHFSFKDALFVTHICGAGINVRELTGGENAGWIKRVPCVASSGCSDLCDRYQEPTDAEIAQSKAALQACVDNTLKALPLMHEIKEEYRNKGGTGTRPCPVCHNTLHFAVIQSNGHTRGRCETDGCVSWME